MRNLDREPGQKVRTDTPAWLGEIPKNWKLAPSWTLFEEGSETADVSAVHLTPSRQYGVVSQEEYTRLSGHRPNQNAKTSGKMKMVSSGDFVISMGSHESGIEYSPLNGKVSNDYRVLRSRSGVETDYFRWFFKSKPLISGLQGLTTEIRKGQRIHYSRFALLKLPLPDLDTQRRIADYLDTETAQIDAMMAKLDEQMELLRERRVAYTRNMFDQYGRSASPLGYHTSVFNGSTPARSNANYWTDTGGIPWFNSSVVNNPRITQPSRFVTELAIRECHLPSVCPGDVLIGITGQGRTRGMVGFLEAGGTINQHVASIRPKSNLDSLYLYWCLVSQYQSLRTRSEGAGATKAAITIEDLRSTLIPLPPLDEQRRIVAELDEKTAQIDAMITKCEELKTLLQERRAALITAVVTGQKEVPSHD